MPQLQQGNASNAGLRSVRNIPAMDWTPMSPQNSCVEILSSNVMIFSDGAFAGLFSHKDGAPTNETAESFQTPSAMWEHRKMMAICEPEVGPHQNMTMLAPWSWTFHTPELWEISVVSRSPSLRNFCYSSQRWPRQYLMCIPDSGRDINEHTLEDPDDHMLWLDFLLNKTPF